MKRNILIIIILFFTTQAFAANTYTLTVKVISQYTHQPAVGFKVSKVINKVKTEIGLTDAKGKIEIENLRDKNPHILVEDPNGKHRTGELFYYNPKRKNETKVLRLYLTWEEEEKLLSAIDQKYEDGAPVSQIPSGKSSTSEESGIDFEPATPKDGLAGFMKAIMKNLEYPQDCITSSIQGKVYLSFIVQKDGQITHVKVVKGVHQSLDAAAVRAVRYCPKWIPATSKGKPIKSMIRAPVAFTLQ